MGNKQTLNISRRVNADLISKIDRQNYFNLNKDKCERKDLYNFAVALGVTQGYTSPLDSSESFTRGSYVINEIPLYNAIVFKDKIQEEQESIDKIADVDFVYPIIEQYANTGFSVLKGYLNDDTEESLLFSLFSDMDDLYADIEKDL